MSLTPLQRQLFDEVKNRDEHQSLYTSLHRVGDDPIKAEIEANLEELLDENSLRIVRAVFQIYTDDKTYDELESKGFFGQDDGETEL
jgi:hypothetical protein